MSRMRRGVIACLASFALVACGDGLSPSTRVDVTEFGARGDGITDDTRAIQAAIDSVSAGGTIVIPDGTYLINLVGIGPELKCRDGCGGLVVYSNQTLELSPNAVIKSIPCSQNYQLLRIEGRHDVTIRGGTFVGDRYEHTTEEPSEWGQGILVASSTSVVIEDVVSREFWGDGFYVGPIDGTVDPSSDVHLRRVTADKNRRQGLSITDAFHVTVEDSQFTNTQGTPPEAGIDIEPDVPQFVRDVQVTNSTFSGNTYGVLMVAFTGITEDNVIAGNTITGNRLAGVALLGDPDEGSIQRNVIERNVIAGNTTGISIDHAHHNQIEECVIERNSLDGIRLTSASYNTFSGNSIAANGGVDLVHDNVRLDDGSSFNVIANNAIRRGSSPLVSRYGIHVSTADCVGTSIVGNDLRCAGVVEPLSDLGTATVVRSSPASSLGAACLDEQASTR